MTGPPPPAGWYPDPGGSPNQRWWSGIGWTDHLAPLEGHVPEAATVDPTPSVPMSRVPHSPDPTSPPDPEFAADRFDVRQRFKLSTNVYEVSAGGRQVVWARQKIMAMRERLEFWRDDTRSQLVCAVQARNVLDPRGTYDVVDGAGIRIAVFRKAFSASLVRSTWSIEGPDGTAWATVTESNLPIAVIRRAMMFVELIPVIGWALALIPIPFHFVWLDPTTGRELGRYVRILGIRERYELHLGGDPERRIDRRAAVAMAICLDALQGR
jgi:hypothetical protein